MRALCVATILLVGCGASLEQIDPVVYVKDTYCPDEYGRAGKDYPHTRLVAGNLCCSWQGMGAGQCPDNTYCMNVDSCSTPVDLFGASSKPVQSKRVGLR